MDGRARPATTTVSMLRSLSHDGVTAVEEVDTTLSTSVEIFGVNLELLVREFQPGPGTVASRRSAVRLADRDVDVPFVSRRSEIGLA